MGPSLILSVLHTVTLGTMLKNNVDNNRHDLKMLDVNRLKYCQRCFKEGIFCPLQGTGPLQHPTSPLYTPGSRAPHNLDFSALSGQDHSLPLASLSAYPKMALSDLIVHSQSFITDSQSQV